MRSIVFDIELNKEDELFIKNKQKQYSCAHRKSYANLDNINEKEFKEYITDSFNLSVYEYNCLKIDVNIVFKSSLERKQKQEKEIILIEDTINELNQKSKDKKNTRKIFKLNKKLKRLNKTLSKDITFGGIGTLRQISKLSNNKEKNKEKLLELKQEYKNKRLLPVKYFGSLNDPNSNRYFTFDFDNNKIIYKPNKDKKIEIKYIVSKKYKKDLEKLQLIKDSKELPISVILYYNKIIILFDDSILNGYSFDAKNYKRELIENKNLDKKKNSKKIL